MTRSARTVVAAAVAALTLSGCVQSSLPLVESDPQVDERTVTPPTVLRTPALVPAGGND